MPLAVAALVKTSRFLCPNVPQIISRPELSSANTPGDASCVDVPLITRSGTTAPFKALAWSKMAIALFTGSVTNIRSFAGSRAIARGVNAVLMTRNGGTLPVTLEAGAKTRIFVLVT